MVKKPTRKTPAMPKTIKGLLIKLIWKKPKMFLIASIVILSIIIFSLTCEFSFKGKGIEIDKDKLEMEQIKAMKRKVAR